MRMTTEEVAKLMGCHPRTLFNWRKQGKGPPYYVLPGGLYYESAELEAWLLSRRVVPGSQPPRTEGAPAQ